MKPRLFAAILLAALWLSALLGLLQQATPVISSPAARVSASPLDVVINEVAWAGTSSSTTSDEWIELYNTTDISITLNGWKLRGKTLNAALSGIIPAKGYYLIERTNDSTVSDIPADWIGSFGVSGLPNTGDVLTLTDNISNAIDTANGDGGGWPAGTAGPNYYSMERINPLAPDTDANWASNDGIVRNGLDANGNPINGAPKQPNSATAANLGIVKSAPPSFLVDQPIHYTLTFSNVGRLNVVNAVITDILPLSVTFACPASPYTCTADSQALAWQVGALLTSSGNLSLTFVVTPEAGFVGWLTNTAMIASKAPDYHPANNIFTATTLVVQPSVDLHVSKFAPGTAIAGREITYVITLGNIGQLDAPSVHVTDTLPISVTFLRQSAPFTLTLAGRTLVWRLEDVLTSATLVSWTVTGLVDVQFTGAMTNLVQASASTYEPILENNSAQAVTLVSPPPPVMLVNGVLYDGYQLNDEDEAVQLVNVGPAPVNLQNWRVTRSAIGDTPPAGVAFPTYTLQVNQRVWAARNAVAFRNSFGFWPDFAVQGTLSNSTALTLTGSWSEISNSSGSDVQLKNAAGQVVDRLIILADTSAITGWSGVGVYPARVGGAEGQILARVPDEAAGWPISDTDTAADWIQSTANYTTGRRVLYPGWDMTYPVTDMARLFWPFTTTTPVTVTLGIAPDNAFELVRDAIRSARHSIEIEAYELTSYGVITEIVQQARAGVSVTLLLEGSPVGGLSDQERWACQEIEKASGQCWFMFTDGNAHIHNRYDYIHAKSIILDHQRLIITTQNLSGGGMPDDAKSDGTYGSRGYALYIESPELAARAGAIFDRDRAPDHADIARWGTLGFVMPGTPVAPITLSGGATTTVLFPAPSVFTDATQFELFTAPEAALRQSDALLGLLGRAGAGDAVYVEQLYEYPDWGDAVNAPNVRLTAYVDAARRGAKVRILLNSGSFDVYADIDKNITTTTRINALARAERLDLQARLGNPTRYGIHSKLVLVKLNGAGVAYSHVGSLNGSEASSKVNRELAVQVESHNLYAEMARVFETDWNLSAPIFMPLVMQNYKAPDHLLISEVYYSATVTQQWAEIYNPTGQAVDLSDYKLGDAEVKGKFEGMYHLPAGAVIGPGGVLVIAFDATQVPKANFQMCSTCGSSAPVMPKYAEWGKGDWALRGAGDQVLLLGPGDIPVDVVVYGDAAFPNVAPQPGVSVSTHSLERYPASQDTDNCAVDFRDRYPPTPGAVPP